MSEATAKGKSKAPRRIPAGFTLLETILAVLLGGAVAALSAGVAVQNVLVRRDVDRALQERWTRIGVFRQFEQDLRARLRELPEGVEAVTFPSDPGKLVEILALAEARPEGSPFPGCFPARITYVMEEPTATSGKQLIRSVEFLGGASAAIRTALAEGLREASVECFRDGSWFSTSGAAGSTRTIAKAVRLRIAWGESSQVMGTRTVLISDGLADD